MYSSYRRVKGLQAILVLGQGLSAYKEYWLVYIKVMLNKKSKKSTFEDSKKYFSQKRTKKVLFFLHFCSKSTFLSTQKNTLLKKGLKRPEKSTFTQKSTCTQKSPLTKKKDFFLKEVLVVKNILLKNTFTCT